MKNLGILKVSLFVVFLGWIMIWVMVPTSTYKYKWSPKLKNKFNSTYFQAQGTNLVLFTFPVMLVAAFGCLYLHLQSKQAQTCSKRKEGKSTNPLSILKRPVAVVAPLGIVTATELAFLTMFIALLIWSLSNYLHTSFSGHLHSDPNAKIWQAKFRSVSLRLGYVGNICWAFLFFPVTRGSSILPLFGLTSESSIKYHIWLGQISTVLFIGHTLGFIIYWHMIHEMSNMVEWSATYVSNLAGVIAIVFAIAIWVTSFHYVRRKMFELFFYTHQLYAVYFLFYALHVGAAYLCMILPGIFLFLVDRYLRFLQSRTRVRLLSARLLPTGNFEITFAKAPGTLDPSLLDKRLHYNPTSILFLNVPSISKLQWHPFTVTSNSKMEADRLSVVIAGQGSWSQKLHRQLSSGDLDHLQVSVEGPYGPTSSHFLSHEMVVMVSGGSGITPFVSIIREIITTSQTTKPKNVLLVCAFKHIADLSTLDLLLPVNAQTLEATQFQLQIEAYITRDQAPPAPLQDTPQKPIQTVWFKPSPSDKPVAAALGPNSWLWLGAIIASSFVMFIVLLASVTRYYIYPKGNSTESTYHYSYIVLWDIFLVCASVFVVASSVFLFVKRRNDMEGKQVQSWDAPSPMASPGPCPEDWAGSELESLPRQCLVQGTNVHFGARPDLKKILSELKAPDAGVLVSGPRKLRHDVSKICGSNNLHCESISFNW